MERIIIFIQIYAVKFLFPQFWTVETGLIYSQAKHETGNFNSTIYKENKNLFGMKQARIRENTATGSNRGHATYSSKLDSIKDYFLRQKNFKIKANNYVENTVNSGYAEDKSYTKKWLNIYNLRGFKNKLPYLLIPSIIIVAYLIFFKRKEIVKWIKRK